MLYSDEKAVEWVVSHLLKIAFLATQKRKLRGWDRKDKGKTGHRGDRGREGEEREKEASRVSWGTDMVLCLWGQIKIPLDVGTWNFCIF